MAPKRPKKVNTSKMTPKQLEAYYKSPAFMEECVELARLRSEALVKKRDSSLDHLWEDPVSSASELSVYDPPRLEAYLYHCGTSGSDAPGPKLVYRTSRDNEVFIPPASPEAPRRLMWLGGLPQDHKLRQNGIWRDLGSEVSKILKEHDIQWTSLDLVRFRWDAESEEESTKDEDGYYIYGADGPVHVTPVTIWVGVNPGTTTGEQAHHASTEVLTLLRQHDITDVELAFRESQVWPRWS